MTIFLDKEKDKYKLLEERLDKVRAQQEINTRKLDRLLKEIASRRNIEEKIFMHRSSVYKGERSRVLVVGVDSVYRLPEDILYILRKFDIINCESIEEGNDLISKYNPKFVIFVIKDSETDRSCVFSPSDGLSSFYIGDYEEAHHSLSKSDNSFLVVCLNEKK